MKMATKLNAKNIYYSFAEARKARNISQVELSKKTGIIQADISRSYFGCFKTSGRSSGNENKHIF